MLQNLKFKVKKHWGQNFLVNLEILDKLEESMVFDRHDTVIEIGPGLGSLTERLLNKLESLHVVEIDQEAVVILQDKYPALHIIHQDVLCFDFDSVSHKNTKVHVVGNLPYNISTAIIFKLIAYRKTIASVHIMLQKEVAEKITATTRSKNSSALTMAVQYFFTSEALLNVGPENFKPQPQVQSQFLKLMPRNEADEKKYNLFIHLVKMAYRYRRKQLKTSIGDLLNCSHPLLFKRPEELSVEDFLALTLLVKEEHRIV